MESGGYRCLACLELGTALYMRVWLVGLGIGLRSTNGGLSVVLAVDKSRLSKTKHCASADIHVSASFHLGVRLTFIQTRCT